MPPEGGKKEEGL